VDNFAGSADVECERMTAEKAVMLRMDAFASAAAVKALEADIETGRIVL
jgi:hypothetical protein